MNNLVESVKLIWPYPLTQQTSPAPQEMMEMMALSASLFIPPIPQSKDAILESG